MSNILSISLPINQDYQAIECKIPDQTEMCNISMENKSPGKTQNPEDD